MPQYIFTGTRIIPPSCQCISHPLIPLLSVHMENSEIVNYKKISHHFKFNYSQIKALPPEQFVSSPVFHALGHDWVIDCYPQGLRRKFLLIKSTTFFVRVQGEWNKKVDPTFSCSLFERDGTMCPLLPQVLQKKGIVFFQLAMKNPPPHAFIFPYQMENRFVNNGYFELICSVNNVDKCSMGVPKSFDFHSQIGKLLENREMADVTFDVKNRAFTCHRLILAARSHVLKAELFGNMAEATQKCIKIKDMSPEVFEAMLHFMYTDSFPRFDSEKKSTQMAQQLFEASDRYAIDGLKALCEDYLCAFVSLDTVAATLALAEQHKSLRLKSSCLEYLAEPGILMSWMLTNEYVDLARRFPTIVAEIKVKVDTVPSFRNIQMRNT